MSSEQDNDGGIYKYGAYILVFFIFLIAIEQGCQG